jgi:hypothetical protein
MEGRNAAGERLVPDDKKVYQGETADWIKSALLAGVPLGHVEYILLVAALHDKKPSEIQAKWMDAHVGVQQIFREL